MSDLTQLLLGSALIIAGFGSLMAFRIAGKTLAWVRAPFVGPSVAILIVTSLAIGSILISGYFTSIDDINVKGKLI
jgi:hypothetical protein